MGFLDLVRGVITGAAGGAAKDSPAVRAAITSAATGGVAQSPELQAALGSALTGALGTKETASFVKRSALAVAASPTAQAIDQSVLARRAELEAQGKTTAAKFAPEFAGIRAGLELTAAPAIARTTLGFLGDILGKKEIKLPENVALRTLLGETTIPATSEKFFDRAQQSIRKLDEGQSPLLAGAGLAGFTLLSTAEIVPGVGGTTKSARLGANLIAKHGDEALDIVTALRRGDNLKTFNTSKVRSIRRTLKKESIKTPKDFVRLESVLNAKRSKVPTVVQKATKTEPEKFQVGNIRLDKFNVPNKAREELATIIRNNDGFIDQRRGRQSIAETDRLADQLKVDINLKAGTALNAEELQALGNTVGGLQRKVDGLVSAVNKGDNSDLSLLKLAQAREELALALSSYSGATAEAGRSLNVLRNIRRAIDTGDSDLIRKAIKQSGGRKNAEEIATQLALLGDDEVAKYRYVKSLNKPKALDYLNWYWYSNVLSGPLTQMRNITGNASNTVFDLASKPFAAALDSAGATVKRAFGKEATREVFLDELPQDFIGSYNGIKQGMRKAMFVLKEGFSMDDVVSSELRPPEVLKGPVFNIVGRGLESMDTFFKSIASQRALQTGAYARAKKSGLKGAEFNKKFQEILTDPPVDLIKEVEREGRRAVFRDDPGPILQGLTKLRDDITYKLPSGKEITVLNPIKFVIPFVQTPGNVIKQGLEATPAGLVPIRRGATKREIARGQGRAALGSTLLLPATFMAAEGNLSGSGPEDPEIRAELYRTGWQPNSVKIGDKWVSYQSLQPIALPLSLIANAFESYTYNGKKPDVGDILARVGNSLLDQSFLTGISSLQKALEDPDRFGSAFIRNLGTSFVPGSSALGQTARAVDTTVRLPETFGQSIQAMIPGQSQKLAPLTDVLGNPAKRPGGFFNQFNPFKASKVEVSALEAALDESDINLRAPARTLTNTRRKMNNREFSDFNVISGNIKETILSNAIESPMWDNASQKERAEFVREVENEANRLTRDVMAVPVEFRTLKVAEDPENLTDQEAEFMFAVIEADGYDELEDTDKKTVLTNALEAFREPTP